MFGLTIKGPKRKFDSKRTIGPKFVCRRTLNLVQLIVHVNDFTRWIAKLKNVKLPRHVWILCLTEGSTLEDLSFDFTMHMIGGFLPHCKVTLLYQFFPAQTFCHILNRILFIFETLTSPFPSFPVFLPVYWWPRQNPISART